MNACPANVQDLIARRTGLVGAAIWLIACSTPALAAEEDWSEAAVSPPATFQQERLIALDVSPASSLRYGLDPTSLSVGADGVVRYVLIARSNSGALNVLFEGIRCQTAEMKSYARWNPASAWNVSAAPAWRPLQFSGPTRHGMVLAKSGICDGDTTNGDAANIVKRLTANAPLYR